MEPWHSQCSLNPRALPANPASFFESFAETCHKLLAWTAARDSKRQSVCFCPPHPLWLSELSLSVTFFSTPFLPPLSCWTAFPTALCLLFSWDWIGMLPTHRKHGRLATEDHAAASFFSSFSVFTSKCRRDIHTSVYSVYRFLYGCNAHAFNTRAPAAGCHCRRNQRISSWNQRTWLFEGILEITSPRGTAVTKEFRTELCGVPSVHSEGMNLKFWDSGTPCYVVYCPRSHRRQYRRLQGKRSL